MTGKVLQKTCIVLLLLTIVSSPVTADCDKLSCRTEPDRACDQREYCGTSVQACVKCTMPCQRLAMQGNSTICESLCPGWINSCLSEDKPDTKPKPTTTTTSTNYARRLPEGLVYAFVSAGALVVVVLAFSFRHEIHEMVCCHYHCPRIELHHHHHHHHHGDEGEEAPMNPDKDKEEDVVEGKQQTSQHVRLEGDGGISVEMGEPHPENKSETDA